MRIILLLILFISLVACVPNPTKPQVAYDKSEAGTVTALNSSNIGPIPVGTIIIKTITFQNNGKMIAKNISYPSLPEGSVMKYAGGTFPGNSGTCTSTLAAGKSCTVSFQAYGNEIGSFSQSFNITYDDGINRNRKTEINLNGYIGTPASIEVLAITEVDFGLVEPNTTKTYQVTIQNGGQLPALSFNGTFVPSQPADDVFHFAGGSFPGTGGTCPSSLSGGQSCKVVLASTPRTAGRTSTGTFQLFYTSPIDPDTISLSLKVFAAEVKAYLEVTPEFSSIDYAVNQAPDAYNPTVTWTVTNVGYAPAKAIALQNPTNVPLTFVSSSCNPTGLLRNETCDITYRLIPNYPLPLAGGLTYPINFTGKNFYFKYDDSKYPTLAETTDVFLTTKVKGEGHLVLYKDGDVNKQMSDNHVIASDSDSWDKSEWYHIIGSLSPPLHSIKLQHPSATGRIEVKNITYSITPDDGQLIITCKASNSCAKKIQPGSYYNLGLKYDAQYILPYNPLIDYTLHITYDSGVRTKTYDVLIHTESKPIPILSLFNFIPGNPANLPAPIPDSQTPVLEAGNIDGGSIITERTITKRIVIKNTGISPFVPNVLKIAGPNSAYFDIPIGTNNCLITSIGTNQSCTVDIAFRKDTLVNDPKQAPAVGFQLFETVKNDFIFDNGMEITDPDYETFTFSVTDKVVEDGLLGAGPCKVSDDAPPCNPNWNMGNVSWSRTGMADKSLGGEFNFGNDGSWPLSHITYSLAGPDADLFTLSDIEVTAGKIYGGVAWSIVTPEQASGRSPINAQIIVRYHGRDELITDPYPPANSYTINLTLTPANEPDVFFTTGSVTSALTPIGFTSAPVPFTFENQGLGTATELYLTASHKDFEISLVPSADCAVTSVVSPRGFKLDLAPGKSCTGNFVYKPTAAGSTVKESINLSFADSDTPSISRSMDATGIGQPWATISHTPGNSSPYLFYRLPERKVGFSVTTNIALSVNTQTPRSTNAVIDTISLVASGDAGCTAPITKPIEWNTFPIIDGLAISDYSISNNTCTNGLEMAQSGGGGPEPTTCSFDITFDPSRIDRLSHICVRYRYFRFTGDATGATVTQPLVARTLAPDAIFKGWTKIIAQGEHDNGTDPFVKLQWNPIEVVGGDAIGTVTGYNIYRRKSTAGSYPTTPLNGTPIRAPVAGGVYEFVDDQIVPKTGYAIALTAGQSYHYYIEPLVNIPPDLSEFESRTLEIDREVRVVMPLPYTVLIHRWYANQITCMNFIGKVYTDLDRNSNYSCVYGGIGGSGGVYEQGHDLLLDRYENSLGGGTVPTNIPGVTPYQYLDPTLLTGHCSAQKVSLTGTRITISNQPKRMLTRKEYMLATVGQSTSGCIVSGEIPDSTGRNACKSMWGAEDLIGNVWEFTQETLTRSSPTTWRFGATSLMSTVPWFFQFNLLDFANVDFNDETTYSNKNSYNDIDTPCISEITGFPAYEIASTCPTGTSRLTDFVSSMGLTGGKYYFFNLDNTEQVFLPYEGTRYLMNGGSHDSDTRFEVPASRWSLYWTLPDVEFTMYSTHTDGPYRGGGIRCVYSIPY